MSTGRVLPTASSSGAGTISGPAGHDHLAPALVVHEVDRGDAEPRRQHAVERRRRPAALHVAEHHDPGLEAGALADLPGDHVGDPAEAHVAELVVDLLGRSRACPASARRPRRRRRSTRSDRARGGG